eukprot:TRINITY_DN22740_c0_g1_i1.p1 TRINITY_DN22740_c0_g1~~TRINITY_DN22740_c0_g1_i1.p1  ORF type:complete len:434 (+),score=74.41 TRINITY_DN22740_c0_g1_i1:91-1392(+)
MGGQGKGQHTNPSGVRRGTVGRRGSPTQLSIRVRSEEDQGAKEKPVVKQEATSPQGNNSSIQSTAQHVAKVAMTVQNPEQDEYVKWAGLVNKEFEITDHGKRLLGTCTSYIVIGVCGQPGVGKTKLCNEMVRSVLRRNHIDPSTLSLSCAKPFPDTSPFLVSMAVVSIDPTSHVIVIDAQGLLHPERLCSMLHTGTGKDFASAEHSLHHQSVCTVMFLLSICNTLLFTMDGDTLVAPTAHAYLQLLLTAKSLNHVVPSVYSIKKRQPGGSGKRYGSVFQPLPGYEHDDEGAQVGQKVVSHIPDLVLVASQSGSNSLLHSSSVAEAVKECIEGGYLTPAADFKPPPHQVEDDNLQLVTLPITTDTSYSSTVDDLTTRACRPSKKAIFQRPKNTNTKLTEQELFTAMVVLWDRISRSNPYVNEYNEQLEKLNLFR